MKYLKLAIGLVILSALAVWARPTSFRGDRFVVGEGEDLRSMTVSIDSLGTSGANVFFFKTPRGMLFTGAAVMSKSAFVGANNSDSAKATIKLKSGATIFTVPVDSGDVWQDYRPAQSSWVHFDSAVTCTLAILDGTGGADGTGGLSSQLVLWYNVDYTNR